MHTAPEVGRTGEQQALGLIVGGRPDGSPAHRLYLREGEGLGVAATQTLSE
jgi:hypothetical protein